jgi:hypothetical protein
VEGRSSSSPYACGGNFQLNFPLGNSVVIFGLPKPYTAAAK